MFHHVTHDLEKRETSTMSYCSQLVVGLVSLTQF